MTDNVIQIYSEPSIEDRMRDAIMDAILSEEFDDMNLADTIGVIELVKMELALEFVRK